MELTPGLRRVPPPDLDAVGEATGLAGRIRTEIVRDGPITFARFMDLALYDPEGGYYRAGEARPGRAGDFLTAPETHPIFGAALARAADEIWQRLDRPTRFVIREYGAGDGALAVSILAGLRASGSELQEPVRYQPIEVDPRRVESLRARLLEDGLGAVLEAPGVAPVSGLVMANEVLDALPVHRVVQRGTELCEVLVGVGDDGRWIDVEAAPTTPALAARLEAEGVALADGQRAEICLAIDAWVGAAAAAARSTAVTSTCAVRSCRPTCRYGSSWTRWRRYARSVPSRRRIGS